MTSRTSRIILVLVSVLAALPVWLSSYPPMCDLPQHAAQVTLLRDLQSHAFVFSNVFRLNWYTPYLFGYIFVYMLTPVFGILTACKIVISLQLVAMPLATGLLLRAARIDVLWAILSIPGLYGFAYQWGLLNFLIAAPVGLLFLYLFMRYSVGPTRTKAVGMAIGVTVLFFCHALICAFFVLIAGCYAIARLRSAKLVAACLAPLLIVVPTAALWLSLTLSRSIVWKLTALQASMPMSMEGLVRVLGIFPRVLGLRSVLASITCGIAIVSLPFVAGERLKRDHAVWVPLCVCLGTLLFVPDTILGTSLVYERFTIFAVPFFLLLLKENSVFSTRLFVFRAAAILLVVGWIAGVSYRVVKFESRVRGFSEMLAQMQPGQRVLSLEFDHDDGIWIAPTLLHFPSWYSAQKHGIVDPNFALYYPELVTYTQENIPQATVSDFEWHPDEFNWNEYRAEQYRYFVLRSKTDRSKQLFSSATCVVTLRYHSNEWWLYERDPECLPNDAVPLIRGASR
jgi:hypothetical protein